MGDIRNTYNNLVRKYEGERSLARPRFRREDNIKMDLKQKLWDGVDWIFLIQDRGVLWVL
jgi:hypothetical protein